MKRFLLAMALVMFAADAHAISRYTSTSMSCAKVQATIQREGAVIMRYTSKNTPGLPLYGRYVADGRYCDSSEAALPKWIPASDTAQCPVYECKPVDFDDDDLFFR